MSGGEEPVPRGYKQTEVGVFPEDWEVGILSQFVIEHKSGIFKNKTEYGTGTNIVGVANIYDIQCIDGQEFNLVNLSNSEISQYTLKENDLLYNESSLVKEGIARTVFVTKNGEGTAFAWHTRRFSVNQKMIHTPYLYFYLQSKPARRFLESVCIQTALTGINTVQFFSCPLICPSLEEQHSISGTITAFSNLIQSLESLLEKKRDIKLATLQNLLTGRTRLPGFTGEWKNIRLENIANIKTGSRNNRDKVEHGKFPFFVRSHTVERIDSFSHDCEAILVPGDGKIGSIFHYINGRFDVHQRVYAITRFDSNACGKYILYFMSNYFGPYALQNTVKATVDSLRLPTFQNFVIRQPPTFEEQEAIAQLLSHMDAEIAALEERLEKTKAIKQGMMQQLLTGRIRLVDPSTPVEASA